MSASVNPIRNFGTKNRLEALRVQLVAGEMAVRLGQRIKQRRREMGINQRELANLVVAQLPGAAVDNQRISDWERGLHKPSERYLTVIAHVLERDISWFYESDATKTPDLFASEVQVSTMANEFRTHVDEMNAKLDAILDKLAGAEFAIALEAGEDRPARGGEQREEPDEDEEDPGSEETG